MHNLDIDTLLQQIITTTGIVDEDTNYLDHINEHNFFTLTDQNRLLVSIWYLITLLSEHNLNTKVTNDVNVNLNSNKVLVDNLNTLKDLLLTVKLNNIDELNNLTVQTTNAVKPVVLTDNVINSIEVSNYSNATYQLTVAGLIGNFSINVLGSLDNTNWFTLPLMTSSLNINNNAVLVNSNSTVMLNVNCNCKYIKLNVMSLPVLTKIDAKLYLK